MTERVTMCCLLLLAVAFLCFAPTPAAVVHSVSQCAGFLLDSRPPQVPGIMVNGKLKAGNRYKVICQTYKNVKRFVTLYDTKNKIPVLSAFKFTGAQGGRPQNEPWKVEPQLENMRNDKNMQVCRRPEYQHQASNNDYKNPNQPYNRGHLFPSCFAFDADGKRSTFTLTNIVPQAVSFNSGSWEKMEKHVKCILQTLCTTNDNRPEAYVVTGATPSAGNKLNSKVNIPSVLWSAFCCHSRRSRTWVAGAFWRHNVGDKSKTTYLPMRPLAKLYELLSTGHSQFEAFPGRKQNPSKCPLNTTVEEHFPDISRACPYPPHHKDKDYDSLLYEE